jgi:hypothetical protein
VIDYDLIPARDVRLGVNLRAVAAAAGWRALGIVSRPALAIAVVVLRITDRDPEPRTLYTSPNARH